VGRSTPNLTTGGSTGTPTERPRRESREHRRDVDHVAFIARLEVRQHLLHAVQRALHVYTEDLVEVGGRARGVSDAREQGTARHGTPRPAPEVSCPSAPVGHLPERLQERRRHPSEPGHRRRAAPACPAAAGRSNLRRVPPPVLPDPGTWPILAHCRQPNLNPGPALSIVHAIAHLLHPRGWSAGRGRYPARRGTPRGMDPAVCYHVLSHAPASGLDVD
jgi:hypothetical protein